MTTILVGSGFLALILSLFPLSVSTWISRDAEFLAGIVLLATGLALTEIRAMFGTMLQKEMEP